MQHDLGDPVPLTIETTDADGQPANAGTITLTITLPDLTTLVLTPLTDPAITNPEPGRYELDYLPGQPGRYSYRWLATGVNSSAYPGSFDVREPNPGYIVGLESAKNHLNMPLDRTVHDEELRGFIEAATPVVEDVVGAVVVRSFEEVDSYGGELLVLQQRPAISLTSLVPIRTGGTSYDPASLDLDKQTAIVRRKDGGWFTGPLRIIYVAGRPIIPANILHGSKEIIRHMWDTQRGHAGARPGLAEEDLVVTNSGFTIPRRAFELLVQRRGPSLA